MRKLKHREKYKRVKKELERAVKKIDKLLENNTTVVDLAKELDLPYRYIGGSSFRAERILELKGVGKKEIINDLEGSHTPVERLFTRLFFGKKSNNRMVFPDAESELISIEFLNNILSDRELRVLDSKYGLFGSKVRSGKDTAILEGISSIRVGGIEREAYDKAKRVYVALYLIQKTDIFDDFLDYLEILSNEWNSKLENDVTERVIRYTNQMLTEKNIRKGTRKIIRAIKESGAPIASGQFSDKTVGILKELGIEKIEDLQMVTLDTLWNIEGMDADTLREIVREMTLNNIYLKGEKRPKTH